MHTITEKMVINIGLCYGWAASDGVCGLDVGAPLRRVSWRTVLGRDVSLLSGESDSVHFCSRRFCDFGTGRGDVGKFMYFVLVRPG